MTKKIQLMLTLVGCFAICALVLQELHAQTKTPPAYWVTETLEISDQAAFVKAVAAVPPTLQAFGGHYIVLGGKISADRGEAPRRITIIAFDSMEKALQWVGNPAAVAVRSEVDKYAKTRNYAVEGVIN
jgi:uncharacterized protein (DUF1330 family)